MVNLQLQRLTCRTMDGGNCGVGSSPTLSTVVHFCQHVLQRVSRTEHNHAHRARDQQLCDRLNRCIRETVAEFDAAEHTRLRSDEGVGAESPRNTLKQAHQVLAAHMPHYSHLSVRVEDIMVCSIFCDDIDHAVNTAARCKGIWSTMEVVARLLPASGKNLLCGKHDLVAALRSRVLVGAVQSAVANSAQWNLQMFLCLLPSEHFSFDAYDAARHEQDDPRQQQQREQQQQQQQLDAYMKRRTNTMHPMALQYVQGQLRRDIIAQTDGMRSHMCLCRCTRIFCMLRSCMCRR